MMEESTMYPDLPTPLADTQEESFSDTSQTDSGFYESEEGEESATDVPGEYCNFVLPENFNMDQEALQEFMPLAKGLGMTQDQAQQAISLHTKAVNGILNKITEHRDNSYFELMGEIQKDPKLGGDNFRQNLGRINYIVKKYGGESDTFHQALAQIAAADKGKARAMYETLDRIARNASVDEMLIGGGTPYKPKSTLYPGLPGR